MAKLVEVIAAERVQMEDKLFHDRARVLVFCGHLDVDDVSFVFTYWYLLLSLEFLVLLPAVENARC